MDAKVRNRLFALGYAKLTGNVSEACRRSGIDRTSFYVWLRRYHTEGIDGLLDRAPVPHSRPRKFAPRIGRLVVEAALQNPNAGCVRISHMLRQTGISISAPTLQRILNAHKLGSKQQRLACVEYLSAINAIALNDRQADALRRWNPRWIEQKTRGRRPGAFLIQGVMSLALERHSTMGFVHFVVDTFSSLLFASTSRTKTPKDAARLFRDVVVPFYRADGFPIQRVLIPSNRVFFGKRYHPYVATLDVCNVRQEVLPGRAFSRNGYVAFVRNAIRREWPRSQDFPRPRTFQKWVHWFNAERKDHGMPNLGRTPLQSHRARSGWRQPDTQADMHPLATTKNRLPRH